jgi:xylan 1,4-beta-xylosidase
MQGQVSARVLLTNGGLSFSYKGSPERVAVCPRVKMPNARRPASNLAVIVPLALLAASRRAKTNRVITVDLKQIKGRRSMVWQDCLGAGGVTGGLREDWRRQLEQCHRELGFKYLRLHGLWQDKLGVYSENRNGRPRYKWRHLDHVYDFVLGIGMSPFVEFGFMSNAPIPGRGETFQWNANVRPLNDYAKWDALITAVVKHWTQRYGERKVKTWRFEVWNEPNYADYWHPPINATPREGYFELYEHTARAVQNVSSNYTIGGPAGAGPEWTADFIEFCHQKNLPLDFISYHAYGLGGGLCGLDDNEKNKLCASANILSVADVVNSQRATIQKSAKPGLPLHIAEWSASYSPRDPVHDSYFSAAFVLEELRRTEAVASMSYLTFTDINEQDGPAPRPFHGGFGLINHQGILKPAFWAYKFLAMLGNTELQNSDESSCACTDEHGGAQILFWDITPPARAQATGQDILVHAHPLRGKGSITITLKNVPPGFHHMVTHQIGYKRNDPYIRYLELGQPIEVNKEIVAELKTLSAGKPTSEMTVEVKDGGTFSATFPLRENDVYLLLLSPGAV